jgi:hypothetical protein
MTPSNLPEMRFFAENKVSDEDTKTTEGKLNAIMPFWNTYSDSYIIPVEIMKVCVCLVVDEKLPGVG